jgi:hypothetical protein
MQIYDYCSRNKNNASDSFDITSTFIILRTLIKSAGSIQITLVITIGNPDALTTPNPNTPSTIPQTVLPAATLNDKSKYVIILIPYIHI